MREQIVDGDVAVAEGLCTSNGRCSLIGSSSAITPRSTRCMIAVAV